jgi:diguanylate cyclase (GGDEF)-like protein/PAS domain S-box-containing protein
MFGYRSDELQERTLFEVLHPADVEETTDALGALLRGEQDTLTLERRLLGQHDMQLTGLVSITMIRDSKARPLQLVVQIADLSELQKAQDLVTEMTLHDPLTGLANRTLVLDRIEKSLERSRYGDRKVAVLHCDVDHFKLINDSAGYLQGDAVLVEIGRRVSRALSAGDSAGRLGGDEFVVVCTEVSDEAAAVAVAERLQQSINTPLTIGERTLIPTVSVGIAISSTPDDDPLTLLQDADIATYRAKELGRNRWDLMDGALRRRALDRLDLEQALRRGIAAGELELHFQPIVDVSSRAVVGREALVRWNHPQRGLLAPMLFLPMAEKSGLIIELGDWVLGAATKAAAAAGDTAGYVAVNVSPNQVSRPGLAQSVQKALAEAGLPAERLVIELTESVMLSAAPSAREEIEHLASLGVRIVVDDFGTGFSALSYLRELPVSGIKVDRSFTAGLGTDSQCDRIVEALTGLGHGLGMDVIVEGVETEQQREIVAAIGAEHAQGYLFGRPDPVFDLTTVEACRQPGQSDAARSEPLSAS